MIAIRDFVANDIGAVAELHREVMATARAMSPPLLARYREWLTTVFLDHPMREQGAGSLVADEAGEVIGFMGVVPRRVALGGKVYRASSASNFCIRANRRGRLGLLMAREFMARAGDLAIVDELSDRTRGIWDRMGFVQTPQSVRWTLPIRPLQHTLALTERHLPRWIVALTRPAAELVDRHVSAKVPRSPYRYEPAALEAETLTDRTLPELLDRFGSSAYLRPVVADGSTAWLVRRARSMTRFGELQMIALREASGSTAGWFIYYARRGPAEVLQAVSTAGAARQVLSHLALHARERGVVSLTGTLDPVFLPALCEHWAGISPSPMECHWRLIYSPRQEILEAFWRDRLLLSRLDGEWCQQFV
jgi:hypothetical protein